MNAVAIGNNAGENSQGANAVAIGYYTGNTNQGENAVAIGYQAGLSTQGANAVAIGYKAGYTYQGQKSVAIGYYAGHYGQGAYSIAIGYYAGNVNQLSSSICINGSNTAISPTTNGLYINPIAAQGNSLITNVLTWNSDSAQVTYSSIGTNSSYSIDGSSWVSSPTTLTITGITFPSSGKWLIITTITGVVGYNNSFGNATISFGCGLLAPTITNSVTTTSLSGSVYFSFQQTGFAVIATAGQTTTASATVTYEPISGSFSKLYCNIVKLC
jgi:hypothetical protein